MVYARPVRGKRAPSPAPEQELYDQIEQLENML